jgi:hypothetical protein
MPDVLRKGDSGSGICYNHSPPQAVTGTISEGTPGCEDQDGDGLAYHGCNVSLSCGHTGKMRSRYPLYKADVDSLEICTIGDIWVSNSANTNGDITTTKGNMTADTINVTGDLGPTVSGTTLAQLSVSSSYFSSYAAATINLTGYEDAVIVPSVAAYPHTVSNIKIHSAKASTATGDANLPYGHDTSAFAATVELQFYTGAGATGTLVGITNQVSVTFSSYIDNTSERSTGGGEGPEYWANARVTGFRSSDETFIIEELFNYAGTLYITPSISPIAAGVESREGVETSTLTEILGLDL